MFKGISNPCRLFYFIYIQIVGKQFVGTYFWLMFYDILSLVGYLIPNSVYIYILVPTEPEIIYLGFTNQIIRIIPVVEI